MSLDAHVALRVCDRVHARVRSRMVRAAHVHCVYPCLCSCVPDFAREEEATKTANLRRRHHHRHYRRRRCCHRRFP